jgi:putative transposase
MPARSRRDLILTEGVAAILNQRVALQRARQREHGTLVDRAPGGNPVHGLLAWEEAAILDLIERWGRIDRSHRKLAHRGSYIGEVFVSGVGLLMAYVGVEVHRMTGPPASEQGP